MWQTLIVILIVALAAGFMIRRLTRQVSGKAGACCGGGGGGGSEAGQPAPRPWPTAPDRTPPASPAAAARPRSSTPSLGEDQSMRAATVTAIAVETGVDWSQDRGTGLRRWVFPAPRSRVKTMRGDAAELHG